MQLPVIAFDQEALCNFGEATQREWLITNGLGGYASSTILGVNTRKYHGLLVAALNPPGDRTVCLSKLDEDIVVGDDLWRLGTNEFQEAVYPQGYKLLKAFSIAPFPTYDFDLGSVTVQKTIFMPKNKNAVSAIYRVSNNSDFEAKVRIYPLLTCRHFHNIVDQRLNPLYFAQKSGAGEFETAFQNPNAVISCRISNGIFTEKINWVEHLFYRAEALRGESSTDDCFQPGCFEVQVPSKERRKEFAVNLAVNLDSQAAKKDLDSIGNTVDKVKESFNNELTQQNNLLRGFYGLHPEVSIDDWLKWILLAANSFIVNDAAKRKAIIAGYHWFEPWGRDTFISMPGLLLVTDRFNGAKDILQNFMGYFKDGLIPNYISDSSAEPVYNTVDGTLWYVNAVLQYLKYTGDFAFVKENLWEKLQAIIDWHEKGTLFGIRLDSDGLLMHGERLTWMDAEVNGSAVTPRAGKAVEIQALWYNALRTVQLLADRFGEKALAEKYAVMADDASRSFNMKFWDSADGFLFDVLGVGGPDASLRPNQVLTVSLDYPILSRTHWQRVVDVVDRELATPYGLRTLAASDPKFIDECSGARLTRDAAYHNGTIWPWLMGPFVTAYVKVNDYSVESRDHAFRNFILPLFSNGIKQAGLGTLNEIYDCKLPNTPRGCISQAWSVAEPLRAYVEDVLQVKPRFAKA